MSAAPLSAPVIGAASEAVRAYLRAEPGAEPALFDRAAASALLLGEAFTGALLIQRIVEEGIAASREWTMLADAPVQSIAGVLAVETAPATLPADGYAIDIDSAGRGWVRVTEPSIARVAVTYTAGLAADWNTLPAPLAQGVVMLAAHLFENRGDEAQPPAAVSALWRPYRRLRLAEWRA